MNNIGQVALGIVGAVVGWFVGGPGGSYYGAMIGASIGLTVGGIIFPPSAQQADKQELMVNSSRYAVPVPVIGGAVATTGNLLCYFNFQSHEQDSKGKGGKGGSGQYKYTVSLVIGLGIPVDMGAETPELLRVWKGKDLWLDFTNGTLPPWVQGLKNQQCIFYNGSQTAPDSHVSDFYARKPVWKGMMYAVLPNFDMGYAAFIPNLKFEIRTCGADDIVPTVFTECFLFNDWVGLGLPSAYKDSVSYAETAQYCEDNDLKVAMKFDTQMSVLDCIQYVLTHHNGYFSYANGLIAHKQLKADEVIGTIREDIHLVKDNGKYPCTLTQVIDRSQYNKVIVEYLQRASEYVAKTAPAWDDVDIDEFGMKDTTVKLDGLKEFGRSSRMAQLLLHQGLFQPRNLEFTMGPACIGVMPGQLFLVTCPSLEIQDMPARISGVGEDENYQIVVSAREEILELHEYLEVGQDTSTPDTSPNFLGDPGTVVNPMVIELPARYAADTIAFMYSKSSNESWAGASAYRAYSSGGSFSRVCDPRPGSGITGTVQEVGEDYIDVLLDWDATLESAVSLDDIIDELYKNLFVVKTASSNIFCKFKDADLIGVRLWRLSGLIVDLVNVPRPQPLAITVGDTIGTYNYARLFYVLPEADTFKTLYFKIPSLNMGGYEYPLSEVDEISEYIDGYSKKPLAPVTVAVNDIGLQDDLDCKIDPNIDTTIRWLSCNRTGTGLNVTNRTDAIPEDTDFQYFRITIKSGSTVKRTVEQTEKSFTYTQAMQATDSFTTGDMTVLLEKVCAVRTSEAVSISIRR